MTSKPGQPKKEIPRKEIRIQGSAKLRRYLMDLVLEEGHGTTVPEVARNLIWDQIRSLIAQGVLDRRPGKYEGDDDSN